jgi:hypothetical protein
MTSAHGGFADTPEFSIVSSQDGPRMTGKMNKKKAAKALLNKGKGKSKGDTMPSGKAAQKRESLNFANGLGKEIELSYVGFNKLKSRLAAQGATNPGALAAAIGRKKYGVKKFDKAAAKGVKLGKGKKK